MSKTKSEIQAEALSKILPLYRCGVSISMGVGKTLLGLQHMDHKYKLGDRSFLVVAPKKSIFQSWVNDAMQFDMSHLIPCIKFCTYIGLPKQHTAYSVIYLDEMHSLLFSHKPWLDSYEGKILGLTGTAPKWDNSEKGQMVSQYCPVVYEYITDDAVGDGILNDYRIIVHKMSLSPIKNFKKKTRDGRFWMTSEVSDYEYWSDQIAEANNISREQRSRVMRMRAMMGYPSKEEYARKLFQSIEEKCILFCNTIDQAHKMSAFSYTSKNPKSDANLQKFTLGEIDKLSCVLQLSEGINIQGLKAGIIMHSYGNERKASQRIGRLLRLNPDDSATMHILCFQDTIDEKWTKIALEEFDQTKITWIDSRLTQFT